MSASSAKKEIVRRHNQCHVADLKLALSASAAVDWPLLILGTYGIGKSGIVAQWAEGAGYTMVDVRLSQLQPEDLGGIPYLDRAAKIVERAMPDIIARCDVAHKASGKPVVLFLDEMMSATPVMQAACFQLVYDRVSSGHALPEGTIIIGAGNTASDRSVVYEMPKPQGNRMMIVEYLGPTFAEYEQYCIDRSVHPMVMTFLKQQPDWVCGHIDPDNDDLRSPTPRSWEAVSKLLYRADKVGLNHGNRLFLVSSAVGDPAALKFEAVLRLGEKIVPFEQIMADPEGCPCYPDELGPSYLQMTMLVHRIETKDQFGKSITYVERLPRELIGVFLQMMMRKNARLVTQRVDVVRKYREFCMAGLDLKK